LNRLITTFDEVPPFFAGRSRQPPAIHIAGSDGVTFKTCTAEVFRPIPMDESTRPSPGSRSARTPPSTFLFLHLHLSNSPGSENPSPLREQASHSTANDNRFPPAVDSLISVRSFRGTSTCLGRGPMQRRAQWPGYRPAPSALSTPVVNKSSHRVENFESAREPCFLGLLRRTWATILRRSGIVRHWIAWYRGGREREKCERGWHHPWACRPFHADERFRRDFLVINSRDFRRGFGSLSRKSCGTPLSRSPAGD